MVARSRVTIEGTLGGGADVWNTSFHMGAVTGYTLADLQAAADFIDATFQSEVWTSTSPGVLDYFAPATAYVRTVFRDLDSAGVTQRVVASGPSNAILGTGAAATLPTEVSEVLSLLTTTAGARGRGRMYLPPITIGIVDGLGLIASSGVADLLDAFQNFFNALNASTVVPDDVSVYSGADGVLREVDTIRMGNVFDAQRRRRNSIPEVYSGRSITH